MAQKPHKMGNGKQPLKDPPSQISDLNLVLNGTTLTSTLSSRARWAGIQKYITQGDTSTAISLTNKYYDPLGGVGREPLQAEIQGPGFYRSWTTDDDYTVHGSNWVQVL